MSKLFCIRFHQYESCLKCMKQIRHLKFPYVTSSSCLAEQSSEIECVAAKLVTQVSWLSTSLPKLATERVLLQSLSLSHREFSPVRQYEGVRVSVEYIEGRNGGHSSHLHCYRAQQRGQHHTYQATHTGQPALGVICTSRIPVKPWMCPSLQQTPQLVSAN